MGRPNWWWSNLQGLYWHKSGFILALYLTIRQDLICSGVLQLQRAQSFRVVVPIRDTASFFFTFNWVSLFQFSDLDGEHS